MRPSGPAAGAVIPAREVRVRCPARSRPRPALRPPAPCTRCAPPADRALPSLAFAPAGVGSFHSPSRALGDRRKFCCGFPSSPPLPRPPPRVHLLDAGLLRHRRRVPADAAGRACPPGATGLRAPLSPGGRDPSPFSALTGPPYHAPTPLRRSSARLQSATLPSSPAFSKWNRTPPEIQHLKGGRESGPLPPSASEFYLPLGRGFCNRSKQGVPFRSLSYLRVLGQDLGSEPRHCCAPSRKSPPPHPTLHPYTLALRPQPSRALKDDKLR